MRKYRVFNIALASVVALCFVLLSEAKSENIPPQDIKIYTPRYTPEFSKFNPPLGIYEYKVAWQGIPAASVKVKVERRKGTYRIITTAKTYKGVDLFYKLRYWALGEISAEDFTPLKTVIDQRENSKRKVTRIKFLKDGQIRAVRYRTGRGKEEINFKSDNFTLDPFSAAFLARGIEWNEGDVKTFDTFNGKSRYLIALRAVRKVRINVAGREREAWEIIPYVANLTNPKKNKKLKSAKIYLSADSSREILRIWSKVFIGSVATTLVKFSPLPAVARVQIISAKRKISSKKRS